MVVELHMPDGAVSNQVIFSLKEEVAALSEITRDIARAEIMLRYDGTALKDDKICEIRLILGNDYIFVRRRNGRFVRSALQAIEDIKVQLLERIKSEQGVPSRC